MRFLNTYIKETSVKKDFFFIFVVCQVFIGFV